MKKYMFILMTSTMEITKVSMLSGKLHTMDLPVTSDQLRQWYGGELIQVVMPELTPEQREFLISGITPEEWDKTFKDLEDDDTEL